jgi:hypothetical protein
MVKKKNKKDYKLIIMSAIAVIILCYSAFVVMDKSSDDYEKPRVYFLEGLQGKADDIATLKIYTKGKNITIRKINDRWVLDEKYDYVVDDATINKFIVNAQQLKIVEKKTTDTERFGLLGLNDYDEEDSFSARIVMSNATDDKVYSDFVRGKLRSYGKLNNENAIYVRNYDENQAWLVKGDLAYEIGMNIFINKAIYQIAPDRVMKVTYSPNFGEEYDITRMMPTVDFDITRPSSAEPHSKHTLNEMGQVLGEKFKLVDVRPDVSNSFKGKYIQQVTFKTYDGIEISVDIVENSLNGAWAKISARAFKSTKESEAKRINLAAKGWLYKLSDETSEFLLKKLSDIQAKTKNK